MCEEYSVFDAKSGIKIKIFTENANDDGSEYKGKLNWKSISSDAAKRMQNFVRVVNSENYESFVEEEPAKNKILIFTERKSTAPLFRSLSKHYKEKLVFGEVKSSEKELYKKFGVKKTPTIMALTDPHNFAGEVYETEEIKIDQFKKFLSNYAYQSTKQEKKAELHHLTYNKVSKSPTGLCGKKSSNLCLILFLKGKGEALTNQYLPLVEHYKSDPISITYVHSNEEPNLIKQFGIKNEVGAVIYKPKRNKFVAFHGKMENLITPEDLSHFIDNALGGGGDWEKTQDSLQFKESVKKDEL